MADLTSTDNTPAYGRRKDDIPSWAQRLQSAQDALEKRLEAIADRLHNDPEPDESNDEESRQEAPPLVISESAPPIVAPEPEPVSTEPEPEPEPEPTPSRQSSRRTRRLW